MAKTGGAKKTRNGLASPNDVSIDWLEPDTTKLSPPAADEEDATACSLMMRVGGVVVTRHRLRPDGLAGEHGGVTDVAEVPAYPLALWIAYNWWRLIFEPQRETPSFLWRSAHDFPAIGHGYAWPPLRVAPFGDRVRFSLLPLPEGETRSIAYDQYDGKAWNCLEPREKTEGMLSLIVRETLSRLQETGHKGTQLHSLWNDLCAERRDPDYELYRILEACLGYDPDKAPEEVVSALADYAPQAGRASVIEIAIGMSVENGLPGDGNGQLARFPFEELGGQGLEGRFDRSGLDGVVCQPNQKTAPWRAGLDAAKRLRCNMGLDGQPLSDDVLGSLLGLTGEQLANGVTVAQLGRVSMSLGIPGDGGAVSVCLHKPQRTARRFYAARLIAEHLLRAHRPGDWLPATYGTTWHQRFQRSFAAEFICPFRVIAERLKGRADDKDMQALSMDYGMEPVAILTHRDSNRDPYCVAMD